MPEKNQPIKVLQFICSTGFYGAERWILALAKHFSPEEVQCDLIVTDEVENQDLKLVQEYQTQCAHVGQVHRLPMRNRFDFQAIGELAKIIEHQGIDIIHTHGYKSDIMGVMAARKAGIQSVVTPHGFENADDLKLRAFIWLGGKVMRFGTVVAPLSPQLMADARAYGVPEDKLHYIQNGVDLSEVDAARTDNQMGATKPAGKKRIGFIGQMISRKNIGHILSVFDTLYQQRQDIELVFVGDGEERSALQSQADQLASRDDIHFLGFRDDRLALLKSFDLFVMTSTLEGIPRCLMETLAMGVPVAAYDIKGVDELITHNKTGLLAPLNDQKQLADHWQTLLDDTSLSERLATAGREFVHQHFSAARMAREYTELFKTMVSHD